MPFKKLAPFVMLFSLIVDAQTKNKSPAQEIEQFLKSNSRQSGAFIVTSTDPEDDDDEFLTFQSSCEWNVEKQSFTFTLFDHLNESELGKFVFSMNEGFRYFDSKKKSFTKSASLDLFFKAIWLKNGAIDLNKNFSIERKVILSESTVEHIEFKLNPKAVLPKLALKSIEVDFDPKVEKLKFLRFQVGTKSYIWSVDD